MKTIVCLGAALIDETFNTLEHPVEGTSNPSEFYRSPGGVSFNIAYHLSRLGNNVELITHIGDDHDGNWLANQCTEAGINISHSVVNSIATGRYAAILNPKGELLIAAAAMSFDKVISAEYLKSKSEVLNNASIIQADCNLSAETLEWLIQYCRENKIQLVIDPVSVVKAKRLTNVDMNGVLLITPNSDELNSIFNDHAFNIDSIRKRRIQNTWLRNGKDGSNLITDHAILNFHSGEFCIKDVTGAGDAGLAGWIHYYQKGAPMNDCIIGGIALSEIILMTQGGTLRILDEELLNKKFREMKKRVKIKEIEMIMNNE